MEAESGPRDTRGHSLKMRLPLDTGIARNPMPWEPPEF